MKRIMSTFALSAILFASCGLPVMSAFAAENSAPVNSAPAQVAPSLPSETVAASPAAEVQEPASELDLNSFLGQVLQAIKNFGGLPTVLKIASIIALIVASMKVSILNELLWSKLGAAKVWVAPLLGLVAGVLDLAQSGQVTLASVFAYISAGAGAIILHELLDSIKKLPKLGQVYVTIIELIQKALKGPAVKK